jgi:hypothetical protein
MQSDLASGALAPPKTSPQFVGWSEPCHALLEVFEARSMMVSASEAEKIHGVFVYELDWGSKNLYIVAL